MAAIRSWCDVLARPVYIFAAEDLRLPFVPPFLTHNGSFCQGANFAVAGAFARNASFYSQIPVVGPFALNTSSSVQMQWFDSLNPSLCNPAQGNQFLSFSFTCMRQRLGLNQLNTARVSECTGFFHKSLFFMGEFGVNDYSFSVFGMNISEIGLFQT